VTEPAQAITPYTEHTQDTESSSNFAQPSFREAFAMLTDVLQSGDGLRQNIILLLRVEHRNVLLSSTRRLRKIGHQIRRR